MVDALTTYNAILGCSTLKPNQMVHSTYHQIMKFLTPHGIRVMRGDQLVARNCYVHSIQCHVLKKKEMETLSIQNIRGS